MARRPDFETEALKYMDQLYYTALKITGDAAYAEDLVQETYLKAYKAWPKLADYSNCKAWLFKIMINTWNNERLKRSKEIYYSGGDELEVMLGAEGAAGGASGPETQVHSKMLAEVVEGALNEMPENMRVLIHLADIEGFSYKEISDILSIPIGTVMSRLFRARGRLEKSLAHLHQGLQTDD